MFDIDFIFKKKVHDNDGDICGFYGDGFFLCCVALRLKIIKIFIERILLWKYERINSIKNVNECKNTN